MVITYPYPPVVDQIAGEAIRHIRITLRRDMRLAANKRKISAVIARFETEKSWTGHIAVDVDPV